MKRIINQSTLAHRVPFFYGWVAIIVAALGMFVTGPGQTFSFSLFIEHFIADFGWTRTQVNTYYSIASLISGLSMFLVGRLVDKKGAKKIMLGAALLLAIAMVWLSFAQTLIWLFIGFFLGRFSGQSAMSLASETVAPQWFVKKRGVAIMLVGLGVTISNVVLPKLNAFLISTYGWRASFRILGVLLIVVFVPLCAIFLINKPEDVGEHPDGISDDDADKAHLDAVELDHSTSLDQKEAIKTFVFWVLFVSGTQFSMINTGIGLNFVSIFNEGGISDQGFITTMMSLAPLLGIGMTLLSGVYINKVKRPHVLLGVMSLLQAAAYMVLANLDSKAAAIAYTLLMGLSMTLFRLMHGILKPYLFGRRFIGAVSGVFVISWSGGSALGPVLFGLSYDTFGGYRLLLMLCAILPLLTGIILFFVKKPRQRRDVV